MNMQRIHPSFDHYLGLSLTHILNLFSPRCANSPSCNFVLESVEYHLPIFFALLHLAPKPLDQLFPGFLIFFVKPWKLFISRSGINEDTVVELIVQKHIDACGRFSESVPSNTNLCLDTIFSKAFYIHQLLKTLGWFLLVPPLIAKVFLYLVLVNSELVISCLWARIHLSHLLPSY